MTHRISFVKVLTVLLMPTKGSESLTDILKLIFSNLCSPQKFPNGFGAIQESIDLIVKYTQTPETNEHVPTIELMIEMVKHPWLCKACFQNAYFITYALSRNTKWDK